MLTKDQLNHYARLFQVHQSVVMREYLQLVFLNEFYSLSLAGRVYFKGGTAIRLIYKGSRFSEDLDFTVEDGLVDFQPKLEKALKTLAKVLGFEFKQMQSLAGLRYRLKFETHLAAPVFIRLDFSFREPVFEPKFKLLVSRYPLVATSLVATLSLDELMAEKTRAILGRSKLRDFYDFWLLSQLGARFRLDLVNQKLVLDKRRFKEVEFRARLKQFSFEHFKKDLGPFLPLNQRQNLKGVYHTISQFYKEFSF